MYVPVPLEKELEHALQIGPTEYNLLFSIAGFINIGMPAVAGIVATVCGRK
jgi:hypothetical protein